MRRPAAGPRLSRLLPPDSPSAGGARRRGLARGCRWRLGPTAIARGRSGRRALALVLLVGAGLLVRSVQRLFAIPPGFDASQVVVMKVQTAGRRFEDREVTHRFFRGLEPAGVPPASASSATGRSAAACRRLPAVRLDERAHGQPEQAVPLRGELRLLRDHAHPDPAWPASRRARPRRRSASAGRDAELARRVFPARARAARACTSGRGAATLHRVGVAGDVKQASLGAAQADAFYVAPEQWSISDGALRLARPGRARAPRLKSSPPHHDDQASEDGDPASR